MISKSWEKAEIGYVSTFIDINRATNELISVSYIWYEEFRVNSTNKNFDSFESLNAFINELVDAKNESELNSLETQSNEG
ncbi:MAG TPA: hypothetical protein GX708_21150 [Gallicola sp.]|nr:hypothetical protein [Gallicola sp.]